MSETPQQFSPSAIHGLAPEFLSMTALFNAPIDLEATLAKLDVLWQLPVNGQWDEVTAEQTGGASGSLYHFETDNGLTVMLTPVSGEFVPEKGELPEHSFHIMATCFAPILNPATGEPLTTGRSKPAFVDPVTGMTFDADELGEDATDEPEYVVDPTLPEEIQLRRRAIDANTVMTQVMDALMREDAAVGVYRPELGALHTAPMVVTLSDSLSKGEVPQPLWVSIRTFTPDLTNARTLGMGLFGHLDLEVMESTHSDEDVYEMLANVISYLITSDQYLVPGQTIGYQDEELAITQATSPADGASVLRIMY